MWNGPPGGTTAATPGERLVLRHKLLVRGAAVACVVSAPLWMTNMPAPQAIVALAVAGLLLVGSLRALVVFDGDAVFRRTAFKWEEEPLLLSALTELSLTRELDIRYVPLVLRMRHDGASFAIECWAWTGWRALAHRAGHAARQRGVELDPKTARRLRCLDPACPVAHWAHRVVQERSPVAGADAPESVREAALVVLLAGAFGALLGASLGFVRDGGDHATTVMAAAVFGGIFMVFAVASLAWDARKRRHRRRTTTAG